MTKPTAARREERQRRHHVSLPNVNSLRLRLSNTTSLTSTEVGFGRGTTVAREAPYSTAANDITGHETLPWPTSRRCLPRVRPTRGVPLGRGHTGPDRTRARGPRRRGDTGAQLERATYRNPAGRTTGHLVATDPPPASYRSPEVPGRQDERPRGDEDARVWLAIRFISRIWAALSSCLCPSV